MRVTERMTDEFLKMVDDVDNQSELFLLRTKETTRAEEAERELRPVLRALARVAEHELSRVQKSNPMVEFMVVELSNKKIRDPQGNEVWARVGVASDETLRMAYASTLTCPHHGTRIILDVSRKIDVHQLEKVGFTPRGMVRDLRCWLHEILSASMVTMPGGDA
jgi:hypothetical protein